jgi:hypothetical protein
MTLQVWFWILYVFGLLFGFYGWYTPSQPYPWKQGGWNLLIFFLIGILGYAAFGGPLKR